MEYQKLLSEEEISKIYVAEGDIVSFFNLDGKLCTKKHSGEVIVLEDSIKESIITAESTLQEIDDLIGGEDSSEAQETLQASEDLLSIL